MKKTTVLGGLWLASWMSSCTVGGGDPLARIPEETIQEYPFPGGSPSFLSVRDMALAEEGLWVLDSSTPFLTFLSSDGSDRAQMGTEGDGPGEFRFPVAVQDIDGSDPPAAMVWDLGTGRVSRFTSSGDFLGSEPLHAGGILRARAGIRKVSYANPFRIRTLGDTVVSNFFPRRIDRTSDILSGAILLANSTLEPGSEITKFVDHIEPSSSSWKEWGDVPTWDLCGETLVVWSPASREILKMDLAGRTVGSVSLGRSPSPLQDEDVEGYLQRMARLELGPSVDEAALDLGRMARSVRDRFAENRPLVVDLHCEGNLTAWVQTFDTSLDPLGRGPIWQRISADGTSQMVRFPGPFSPFVFTQNGVFGVSENSEGSQTLAWSPAQPGALSPVSHQLSLQER